MKYSKTALSCLEVPISIGLQGFCQANVFWIEIRVAHTSELSPISLFYLNAKTDAK